MDFSLFDILIISGRRSLPNERLLHIKNGSAAPIGAKPKSTADQRAIFAVLPGFVEEKAKRGNRKDR
jgi:hypothetical protein